MSTGATRSVVIPYSHRKWAADLDPQLGKSNVLNIHRGGGKTIFTIYKLIHAAAVIPPKASGLPHRFGYVGKSISHAKQTVWDTFKAFLQNFGKMVAFNAQDLLITMPNGNTILLSGIDDPDKVRGQHFSGLVLDEAQLCSNEVWQKILKPTLNQNDGWTIVIGTPNGPSGFFFDAFQMGEDPNNRWWRSFTKTVHDTGEILPELWEEILATSDRQAIEAEYLCSFVATLNNRVYPNFDFSQTQKSGVTPHIRADIVDQGGTLYVGIDFNVAKMPAVVCQKVQYQGRECLEVVAEIILSNANSEIMGETLRRQFPGRKLILCPDATGASIGTAKVRGSDFDILRRAGFHIMAPRKNPDIRDRITCVNILLENALGVRRLFVSPTCKEVIKTLSYHQLDEYSGLPMKNKDTSKGLDHVGDSLGYTAMQLFPLRKKKFRRTRLGV